LPLPSTLETEVRQELKTIAQTPPYKSVQIVHMGEKILDHCLGYETPYRETAERIRQFVCSNHTQNITGLIEETLRN